MVLTMRPLPYLAVLLVALAGCVESGSMSAPSASSYKDAPAHYYNKISGAGDDSKNVNIPAGTAKLTVKALYRVDGAGDIELRDPTGRVQKSDEIAGSRNVKTESWFETSNPTPGTWKLQVEVAGDAEYAFGFYY